MSARPNRFKRGYAQPNNSSVQKALLRMQDSCLPCSIFWALLYISSIWAMLIGALAAWQHSTIAGIIFIVLSSVVVARQQRGLELMVHDGSHGVWYRKDRLINDLFVNLTAGCAVGISVTGYWLSHRVHHGRFGSDLDPCRKRFQNMGLGHLDLSTRAKVARAVVQWLPSYLKEFYREIGSRDLIHWMKFAVWHASLLIAPLTWLVIQMSNDSVSHAAFTSAALWFAMYAIPGATLLPVIRSIAEAEEHDYELGGTEFSSTYTNVGPMHALLFHPWNDSYHLVHHMYPNISERHHHKVHAILMREDKAYRGSLFRKRVLDRR